MKPQIFFKESTNLMGLSFFGDPFSSSAEWTEENEVGRLWNRFMGYINNTEELKYLLQKEKWYEVWIEHPESKEKGFFEIFVGVEISSSDQVPLLFLIKNLPATEYAVFTVRGNKIMTDWPNKQYDEWLKNSVYVAGEDFMIEIYDSRFKGMDKLEDSELDYYFPVKK